MMKRILEQELMNEPEQARAYAEADFEQPHAMFISLFLETFPTVAASSRVLDLGCGPGDIAFRFARAWPQCHVHGVDGSDAMLKLAEKALGQEPSLQGRVHFFKGMLPELELPCPQYDIIFSNSLLHHLPDPAVLWESVVNCAAPGATVFVMDLRRPETRSTARQMVELYAAGEPEVLRRDFYNSLLAAFTIEEIQVQLAGAGLSGFAVRSVSDRHVVISGRMPG
jgi:ubiquinone/menaquinone biosynthesis C-methylase UbiE